MIRLAARTFADRWPLFLGTVVAVMTGVAIVHAGMTIILGIEVAPVPAGATPEQADAFRQAISGASTLTGMTVLLGGFLTVFVVSSTFGFAVDQRRGDLAILRLGGVTAGQIRRLLLAEAILAAIVGGLAGALLGGILTVAQRALLSSLGTLPPDLRTPFQPGVLALDLITALTVCVAGAWGAARRATRVTALDALRRSSDERRVMTVGRWIVAVGALVLTAVQTYASAAVGGMLLPLLLGLGIVITASVAMSRLSPLLVPAAARALTPWAARSPITGLAVANLRDVPRRTAACAAPMIVLVSLVAGLQGILDTQTEAGATEAQHLMNADLIAVADGIEPERLARVEGVALAAPETVVPLAVELHAGGVTTTGPGTVVAVDPAAFRATHRQRPHTGDLGSFGPDSLVFGPGLDATMVQERYDRITLDVGGHSITLREAARLPETLAGVDGFYLDRSILPAELLDRPTTVLIQLDEGAELAGVRQALTAAGASSVRTPDEAAGERTTVADQENRGVMAAIVGLGSVYALISALSTLALSIGQRRSELATLRLSGLTRRQLKRLTMLEGLTATTIGLLLGAVAAVLALVGLWAATYRAYGTPVVAIPWALLGAITVLVATLTAVTATLATRAAVSRSAVHALGAQE